MAFTSLIVALITTKLRSLHLIAAVPTGAGQSCITLLDCGFEYSKVAFTSLDCGFTFASRAMWRSLHLSVVLNKAKSRSINSPSALTT